MTHLCMIANFLLGGFLEWLDRCRAKDDGLITPEACRKFVMTDDQGAGMKSRTPQTPHTINKPSPTIRARHSCHAVEIIYPADGPHGRAATEPERLDQPAPTITTTEEKGTRASEASSWTFNGGPDRASDATFLATGRRRLTWCECAALQSFPPDYPFAGKTVTSKYRAVGNAAPPPLARTLALQVLKVL